MTTETDRELLEWAAHQHQLEANRKKSHHVQSE